MRNLLLVTTLIVFSLTGYCQTAEGLMKQASALEAQRNESAALFKYKAALKLEPTNFKALWKTSFLSARVGFRVADVNKKRDYFQASMDYASKAFKLKPSNAQSHFVMALAFGRMAQISSAKKRVAMLKDIKMHATKCVQIDPNHAGGYHLLGRLNYRVANLSMAEKAAANIILGGVPKGMSNAKAVAFYKKAVSLNKTYILYWKDLAMGYAKLKQKENTVAALKKAISLPVLTEDDPGYKLSCKAMLNKLQ